VGEFVDHHVGGLAAVTVVAGMRPAACADGLPAQHDGAAMHDELVGIVGDGGYRFLSQDLDEWARRLAAGAMLTALPDQLNGFRLAGRASDNRSAREALGELGLNPLMVEAFRDRSSTG